MTTVYTGDKLKINKYYEHTEIIWIILNFKAANSLMQRICIQCGCVCLCEGGEGGRGSRIWFSGGTEGGSVVANRSVKGSI